MSVGYHCVPPNGNQTFPKAPGRVLTNVYDALNRQVEMLYADRTKTLTGNDADGRKVAVVAILLLVTWWFQKPATPLPQPLASQTASNTIQQPPTRDFGMRRNNSVPFSADASNAVGSGNPHSQANKEEAIQQILASENAKLLDAYGKVIDQYGNPVPGAKVQGSVLLNVSMVSSGGTNYSTETDANGLFSFVGLHGAKLGIRVQKDGYLAGEHGKGYSAPASGTTSPEDRAIFTLWKLRGPEPLVSSRIEAQIPCDGTPTVFSLEPGKKVTEGGDLRISLLRSPPQIGLGPGHPFDWQVKIEMLNGGLVPENDAYPYLAAENGYAPSLQVEMNSNNVAWTPEFEQAFYTKNTQGQYGRMTIDMVIFPRRPKAGITINFSMNPSGSRNLEPSTEN